METKAIVRGVRLSADKGRLVADLIRGKKVDQALNILTFTPEEGGRDHQEGARVGDRERRAQRRRRHRRAEGHHDLRRAGRHAEALLGARQGPRQPHQQADLPHLRDRRRTEGRPWDRRSIRPASASPVTRNWASRWYATNQQLRRHAGRRPEGSRVPEDAAEERRGVAHPDRAPGQERAHHDLLGASGRGDRQEGRGHREPEGRADTPPGRAGARSTSRKCASPRSMPS